MRPITRRQALAEALASALLVVGCRAGEGAPPADSPTGSTLASTWGDPVGDGQLQLGPGEALVDRVELGPRAASTAVLATFAHVTDAHVLDASSPARVTFLDRLGAPFGSTFRPQEALTVHVLAGAARSVRALRAQFVIQGGDVIDNDQSNELAQALAVLNGGTIHPGSGSDGYFGVQLASNPDPFYYRPDVDAPRHPGLLRAATRTFIATGVGAPTYPVLGDHDVLVAGEIAPTALTRGLAVGDRALWELPAGMKLPPGVRPDAGGSPDGPPDPGLVNSFLRQALAGPTVRVPADQARRELTVGEAVGRLRRAAGPGMVSAPATGDGDARLDYTLDVSAHLRLIVLDLVRRGGGSGGLVEPGQEAWLAEALAGSGGRWVIVVTHQPLASSVGGDWLLELLDRSPRVIAAVSGHTHRNRIVPRPTSAGGYWLISTASLIDYPQQARALRLLAAAGGGVALQTWMLDHAVPGRLGAIARQLSFISAQGGRPKRFAGSRLDRNVTLFRRAV